jgi:hypothetical protein
MTRRRFRPAIRLASRVLRIMLVLSLWHAPIPWVHAHEIDGPQVDRLQMLARHVNEFHARELTRGEQCLDWHVHLVLPWCLVHHLPCPEEDQHEPGADEYFGGARSSTAGISPVMDIGQPTTTAFLSGAPAADQAGLATQEVGTRSAILACALGTHFFETYGRTDCVRDLVGVRLC